MKEKKIDRILPSVGRLPTLPVIYAKLSQLLQAPNATIRVISDVISEDPATAAKVLRIVNSAFYGFPQRIGNVQRAVVILGLNEIKNLVLATSILQVFRRFGSEHVFDMDRLWEHSIGCAVASRVLAEAAYLRNPEDVFAGGLMHDIGKLIHAVSLPEKFANVINEVHETGKPIIQAEEQILGFNHAETGRALAVKWHFPAETVNMITRHHLDDASAELTKEIAAVHVGNTLCIALGLGSGGEKRVPVVDEKAWQILGLKLSQLEPIMARIEKLFKESTDILRG
ncbi:MAG: HDOD domain-containing protein [Desulfobacterales bacterium]|nr:HDOD domain-containing protein [Desulfobacterales bacterium]